MVRDIEIYYVAPYFIFMKLILLNTSLDVYISFVEVVDVLRSPDFEISGATFRNTRIVPRYIYTRTNSLTLLILSLLAKCLHKSAVNSL